jgi:hypothetical protein
LLRCSDSFYSEINQRSKNVFLRKSNNLAAKSSNLINYSLSSSDLNKKNKNNISSTYNSNYNTKRNINLEKFKSINFRKDNYCTSIERKRKALGLQFKPNLEKELSIQNDKTKNKNLYSKFTNYNINKRNILNNIISKNKLIKVNKKDEDKINMEGINITPQRFRIFQKKLDNKNGRIFIKNKTIGNFINNTNTNNEIKNNSNNLKIKNKNITKINNIHPNYTLSENNNNSLSQMTDSNLIFVTNNSINNNN